MISIQGGLTSLSALSSNTRSLNNTQQQGLTEALSNYDTDNLSDDDAKSLVSDIQDLGIQKGHALTEALSDAGIDANQLAEQAGIAGRDKPTGPGGPGGGPGGGGGPSGAEASKGNSAAIETLQSIVDQLQETATDDDDLSFSEQLAQALEDAGIDTSTPIVDYRL